MRGFLRARRTFSARANRGWWCSSRVTGWLCKSGGGPTGKAFPAWGQGRFQRGCREGFDGEEEFFQWGGFASGVGVSAEGNDDNGGK